MPLATPQLTTLKALPAPPTDIGVKQMISCEDSAPKGYQSDDRSVSDVPYACVGAQAETGTLSSVPILSDAIGSHHPPDLCLKPSLPSPLPPSNIVSTGSSDLPWTPEGRSRRNHWQAVSDSDNPDTLSPSVVARTEAVRNTSALKSMYITENQRKHPPLNVRRQALAYTRYTESVARLYWIKTYSGDSTTNHQAMGWQNRNTPTAASTGS